MFCQTNLLALFLAAAVAFQGVAAIYDLPEPPEARRDVLGPLYVDEHSLLKRSTHDASFPLAFNAVNEVLFTGNIKGETLTVKCVDCQTTGRIVASAMLPDLSDIAHDITHPSQIFDDSSLGLTFNGVGGTVDLDITAAGSGDFSIPILKTESPLGIAGPGFQVGVVFTVDLVIKINGKVETKGGFKVAIPDGSSFLIPLDENKPSVAKFNGASATLLPLTVDIPADVTVALRVKVQAGVQFPDLDIVEAKALAGAYISIPEVILDEKASFPSSASCAVPVDAELNINAGVFVDIGADLGGVDLGDFNPKASTTLFAASTSTCLKSGASSTTSTKTKARSSTTTRSATTLTTTTTHRTTTTKPHTTKHSSHPVSGAPSQPAGSGAPKPHSSAPAGGGSGSGSGSGSGGGAGGGGAGPSSFPAVAARAYARRTTYPILLTPLATPITNRAPSPTGPTGPIVTRRAVLVDFDRV
ncbi:hypothetical protein F5Y17DRAFT_455122 [Xylariaceae sp. FL0594]|nr:hypothetical protein F5Y17DRAFT_455122 [Xylariaceae sp. FL0594]